MDAVCSLASAFVIRDGLRQFARQGFDYAGYWRRSVLAATAARVLATSRDGCEPEEVFLAALLQDIGMLVLTQAFPEVYPDVMQEANGDHARLQKLEQGQFGTDHVGMGVWLAEIWHLPEIFREAVGASHDCHLGEAEDSLFPLVRCVSLSGPLADIWENPDTTAACQQAQETAEALLQLDEETLHAVLVSVARGFREASEIFKVSIGGPDKIHQILAKALEGLSSSPE
jgi:HD-like signal output (HDOD) protein